MGEVIRNVRDLVVYKKAFDVAMSFFEISKTFPKEEKYSLTDQIRRSSRSVCSNSSEGWRKRRYKAVFLNKLSDSSQKQPKPKLGLSSPWLAIISINRFSKNSLKIMRRYSPCFTPCPKNLPLFAEVERFCFPLPSSFFPLP